MHVALCQVPVITSFSPSSGPVGTQVVISGSNFGANAADNIVYFGAVKANVLTASATALRVEVPTGTTFQPLSVTVNRLTASADHPFIVTSAYAGSNFTATSFDVGLNLNGGHNVTATDLDGDGKTDLVYINSQTGKVNVLRNAIQGNTISLVNVVTISSIASPYFVKTADLDGDGLRDLVVTNQPFQTVYVLKNKSTPGNMAFDNPVGFTTGTEPRNMAIDDLDNDGKPDLVVENYTSNTISVFRNTSTGGAISFSTKSDIATMDSPGGICIGDLDGDGKREIAIAGTDKFISVYKNSSVTGAISFEPRVNYATDFSADVKMADLDGDGKPDLVVSNGSFALSIFRNSSSLNSLSFDTRIDLTAFNPPAGVDVNDLDGDGKPEIVLANDYVYGKTSVYKNNSTPGTISFAPYVGYDTDSDTYQVILADMNGDGLTDIITANTANNSLTYLQNRLNNAPSIYSCPQMLTPVNSATINYGMPVSFTWSKVPNATSYRFSFTTQNGTSGATTVTDTFYAFTPAAGLNYTWTVKPANFMATNPCATSQVFSTCAASANPYTITATGNTTICGTDSVKLQASGATNIQWFLDQKPVPGAVPNFLWAKQGGNYTVRVLNGSCYSDPSNMIKVTILATPVKPVLSIQGVVDFCPGGNVTLVSSTASNNQWFKDGAPIAAATKYYYDAAIAGSYFVQVTNTSTGCVNNSDTATVTVRAVPTAPVISVTGQVVICNGDSSTLQSSAVTGDQWFKNGTAISGATNAVYKAKQSGTYTVKVTQNGCTSAASAGVAITVNALPATPVITAAGNTTFCNGDSVKLQSSATSGNQWFKNNVAIATATGNAFYGKESGSYAVSTTQNGCTSAGSTNVNITVYPLPAKPVITAGTTMISTATGYSSYQWYFNNAIIAGAVTNQYSTTQNGIYRVEITDQNGCKNSSDNFNYVTTAVTDVVLAGYTIQWFPNPVQNDLTLTFSTGTGLLKPVNIWLIDAKGKQVHEGQVLKGGQNKVSMQQLPAGIYLLILQSGDSKKAVKVLKAG